MSELELLTFLQKMWGTTTGTARLATRDRDLRFRTALFKWPEHEPRIIEFIETSNAARQEVYFSPDLFKPEAYEKRSASKDLVLGSRVICLDFDGNAPDPNTWDETGTYEGLPAPSIKVQSSTAGNMHMYWVLDNFITDIDLLENIRKTVTYTLKADGSGWDAGQLLRPPYTTNYGYNKAEREGQTYDVFIEEISDRVYDQAAFPTTRDFRSLVGAAINEATLPSVVEVLSRGSFVPGFVESFTRELSDIGSRKRSDALMGVAYFAAESGLSDTEIYTLVRDADTRWGKYSHRSDRHKRISDIVERARAKFPVGTGTEIIGFNFDTQDDGAEQAPQAIYPWDQLVNDNEQIEWFFDGLLSTTGYGIFAGVPGIGKTQLMLRLSTCVVLNKEFLEPWPNLLGSPGRVLLFSFEMNKVSIKHFMDEMKDLRPYADELGKNLFIYPQDKEILLDNKPSQKVFETYVERIKPNLVIIDSLSKAVGKSLVDDEVVRRLNTYLAYIRKTYHCAIVVVHHSKKLQDRKDKAFLGDLDILYGSRFIGSEADFVLTFTYRSADELRGHTSKLRYSRLRSPFILTRNSNLDFEYADHDPDSNEMVESFIENTTGKAFLNRADPQPGTNSDGPATGF